MSGRTSLYFDLLDACARPGCPVCQVSGRAVERYLDAFSFEQVNDITERARLRAARGFCNRHAWQWWEEQGDRLGAAIVYLDVLTTIGRQLDALANGDGGGRFGQVASALGLSAGGRADESAALPPQAVCPACEIQEATVERAVETLLAQFHEAEFHAAYAASHGICVPHLTRALRRRGQARDDLLTVERERLAALRSELEEHLRKQRHEHRHEPRGPEQTSPRRAVVSAAGEKGATWPPA